MPSTKSKERTYCGCIFSLGLFTLLLWLLLNIYKPTCSIEEFDVFALGKQTTSSSTNHNNTIHYDLKLKNRNFNKGVYYDALNLTFYYKANMVNGFGRSIGNDTFTPFYQGYGKSAHRVGDIEAKGVKLKNDNTMNVFRVELATSVRYKYPLWKSKRHRLVVGANLKVNDEGKLVKEKDNKGIKLRSNARKNDEGYFQMMVFLGVLIFIHS